VRPCRRGGEGRLDRCCKDKGRREETDGSGWRTSRSWSIDDERKG